MNIRDGGFVITQPPPQSRLDHLTGSSSHWKTFLAPPSGRQEEESYCTAEKWLTVCGNGKNWLGLQGDQRAATRKGSQCDEETCKWSGWLWERGLGDYPHL